MAASQFSDDAELGYDGSERRGTGDNGGDAAANLPAGKPGKVLAYPTGRSVGDERALSESLITNR
jgi:hypothetical protein